MSVPATTMPTRDLHECYPDSAANDQVVFARYCGGHALWDRQAGRWIKVEEHRFAWRVVAGPVFLFAGANHESESTGSPPTTPAEPTLAPEQGGPGGDRPPGPPFPLPRRGSLGTGGSPGGRSR